MENGLSHTLTDWVCKSLTQKLLLLGISSHFPAKNRITRVLLLHKFPLNLLLQVSQAVSQIPLSVVRAECGTSQD